MYFNKEWQPSILDIAEKKKDLPKNFPVKEFLELYNAWKNTPNSSSYENIENHKHQGLFAKLRDLHQQYGINSASTVFWSEEEMHAFAKYLQDTKFIKAETRQNLSDARSEKEIDNTGSILINGKEIKKWAHLFLGEDEMVFTGKYKVDTNNKIVEIEIMNLSEKNPGYANIADIAFQALKPEDKRTPEASKYGLEKSRGYAIQELKKVWKTIKDLKKSLKLQEDTIFDQTTLDAVLKYQTDKKLQKVDGLVWPETIGSLWGVTLPIPWATRLPDRTPEPSRRPVVPRVWGSGWMTPAVVPSPQNPEKTTKTIQQLSSAVVNFRKVIQANADKVGITMTRESIIEASQQSINEAYKQVETALNWLDRKTLSSENKKLYDAYVLEVSRYYAGEHNYTGINGKNRYWKNYDRSLSLAASLVADDFKNNKVQVPPVPTESSIRTQIKKIDPDVAAKFEALFAKGYSWWDIMSNPKMRWAWDEIRDKVVTKYDQDLQSVLSQAKKQYDAGQMTFKDDADGSRKKAFELMVDIMGAGWITNISHKSWDRTKDTGLIIGSAIAGTAATIMTGGWAGLALWAGLTTAGTIVSKWRIRDGVDGIKDTGFELFLNGVTFGAGGAIAKTGLKALWWVAGFGFREAGILSLEWTAGVWLNMAVEKARAWHEWIDLSWTEAAKNSWYWALLPLGIHYVGRLKWPANDLANRANTNQQRAEISGVTPAVQAEARQIDADAAKLAQQVKSEHTSTTSSAPSDLPSGWLGIGSKVDPKKAPNPTEDAHPHVSPKNDILPETKTSVNQHNLEKAIQYQFDTLKKEWDSATFGHYTITKDGKNYRVKQNEEHGWSWIKSKDDALNMIKSELKKSDEQSQKIIDTSVKDWLKAFSQWKTKTYEWNGEKYTMKKSKTGDDIEVIWYDGKILAWKELDAFYAAQANHIIDLQKKSFFKAHGEKPIGEALHGKDWYKFTTFDAWKKWHDDRSVLNPIKYPAQFARFSAEQIWDSLKAPIKTLDSVRQWAMRDHWFWSEWRFNGIAKAIVLRDTHADWMSGSSVSTIVLRGLALPVWLTAYDILYDHGWNTHTKSFEPKDLALQSLSVFYGGLIWWSLLSNSITEWGIPPNPFASSQSWAQVPSK
jgi:hypothetical protein